jgi:hypothetical protein
MWLSRGNQYPIELLASGVWRLDSNGGGTTTICEQIINVLPPIYNNCRWFSITLLNHQGTNMVREYMEKYWSCSIS